MTPTRARRSLCMVLVAMVLTAAACSSGGGGESSLPSAPPPGAPYTSAQLGRFAISAKDVPSGYEYVKAESGAQGATCAAAGVDTPEEQAFADHLARLAVQGCYRTLFRKETKESTEEIASVALAFSDDGAAHDALPALRQVFADQATTEQLSDLPAPTLGQEAVPGLKMTGSTAIEGVIYLWRDRNVVPVVVSFHLASSQTDNGVARIAQKVDSRARG